MWWAMMTVTTVGYGDIYLVTVLGKILGSEITIAGVLLLALPSAILATGFIEERQKERESSLIMAPEKKIELLERISRLKEEGNISIDEFETLRRVVLRDYSRNNELTEDKAGES